MLSMYKSNPKFDELDFLLTMRARLMNPAVHFDLKDLPPEKLAKDIDDLDFALEMFFIIRPHTGEGGSNGIA
jgi:hypothetical protein